MPLLTSWSPSQDGLHYIPLGLRNPWPEPAGEHVLLHGQASKFEAGASWTVEREGGEDNKTAGLIKRSQKKEKGHTQWATPIPMQSPSPEPAGSLPLSSGISALLSSIFPDKFLIHPFCLVINLNRDFFFFFLPVIWSLWGVSLVAQLVKNPPAMRETWVWSLGWKDPLEKEMATHSSILAWRIPWPV